MQQLKIRYRLSERELTYLFFWEYYRARGKKTSRVFRVLGGPLLIAMSIRFHLDAFLFDSEEYGLAWLPTFSFSYGSVMFVGGGYFMLRPLLQALMGYFVREKVHESKREVYLTIAPSGVCIENTEGAASRVPWPLVARVGRLASMAWIEFTDGLRIFVPRKALGPHEAFFFELVHQREGGAAEGEVC